MSPVDRSGLRVDLERLKADLRGLAQVGRDPGDRGISRMAFTDADMAGKRWLCDRLAEIGVEPWMDGAVSVHGRLGDSESPAVLVGSHTDTVPRAGMLDGALGVVAGLEVLRVLRERDIRPARPIELVSFSDEEGRFGGMFGSRAFTGRLTPESLHFTALDGTVLHEELGRHGFDAFAALEARRRAESVDSFFELHIEQGPVLDRGGESIGLVDEITGLFRWLVRFRGAANHAGTTPMSVRRDALMGLADFAHEVPRLLEENGRADSRATIGTVRIVPGAANTVPGEVEFSLDVRDTAADTLIELSDACRRTLSAIARRRDLMLDLEVQEDVAPIHCDPALLDLLEAEATRLGSRYRRMSSGAAHDAQILAAIAPVVMIFVPSRDGQSHAPSEWTDWADIEAGANLLLHGILTRTERP